jgi:hypothetical protein
LAGWRYGNGRADGENVIKEWQAGFALPALCLEQFRSCVRQVLQIGFHGSREVNRGGAGGEP